MKGSLTIEKDHIVSLEYRLMGDDGELIDSSDEGDPLLYLHGYGQIVPGLENALAGRHLGDSFSITVPPEDGYGAPDPDLVITEPKSSFPFDVAIGGLIESVDEEGDSEEFTVVEIADNTVTLDGNHPLAGKTLNFEVKVVGVRPATAEELSHGHVHGEGCGHP